MQPYTPTGFKKATNDGIVVPARLLVGREMKRTSLDDATCPIARSLDEIGDWWTLLIVRDAFSGKKRFSDFQQSLGLAKTGIGGGVGVRVSRPPFGCCGPDVGIEVPLRPADLTFAEP